MGSCYDTLRDYQLNHYCTWPIQPLDAMMRFLVASMLGCTYIYSNGNRSC